MLHPVEEEDHAEQEQNMVIPGRHVLGAEVREGDKVDTCDLLNITLVALGNSMCQCLIGARKQKYDHGGEKQGHSQPSLLLSQA